MRMDQTDLPPHARIIPVGEPVEGGIALFDGPAEDAAAFLAKCAPADLAELSVWTRGRIWSPDEFLAETAA